MPINRQNTITASDGNEGSAGKINECPYVLFGELFR